MPPKTKLNPIWNYYTVKTILPVPNSNRLTKIVECKLCQKTLTSSSGTTTPLRNHLSTQHPGEFVNFLTEYNLLKMGESEETLQVTNTMDEACDPTCTPETSKPSTSASTRAKASTSKACLGEREPKKRLFDKPTATATGPSDEVETPEQPSQEEQGSKIVKVLSKLWADDSTLQGKVDVSYLIWLAKTGTPLTISDEKETGNLFEMLNSSWTVKEPAYYGKEVVNFVKGQMYSHLASTMDTMCAKRNSIALTVTVKKGDHGQEFTEIHHTFVDDEFTFQRNLIGIIQLDKECEKEHYRSQFDDLLLDKFPSLFDKDQKCYVTFDRANEVLKYCMEESLHGIEPFPCQAKMLDEVQLKAVEAVPETTEVMALAFKINAVLNNDSEVAKVVQNLCEKHKVPFSKFDEITLGPLSHELLVGLYRMKPALEELVIELQKEHPDFCKLIPKTRQFTLIQELIGPMMIVNMFKDGFQSPGVGMASREVEIYDLSCNLLQYSEDLRRRLAEKEADNRHVMWGLTYAKTTLQKMMHYYDMVFRPIQPMADVSKKGAILHPVYKGRTIFDPPSHKEFLKKMVSEHPTSKVSPKKLTAFKSPYKDEEIQAVDFVKRKVMEFKVKEMKIKHEAECEAARDRFPLEIELQQFMEMPEPNAPVNVLGWWNIHKDQFPLLSQMVKDIFAIQFSVENDQVPRVAGQISWTTVNSQDKTKLANATLSDLLFIQRSSLNFKHLRENWHYKNMRKETMMPEKTEEDVTMDEASSKGKGPGKKSKRQTPGSSEKPSKKAKEDLPEDPEKSEAAEEDVNTDEASSKGKGPAKKSKRQTPGSSEKGSKKAKEDLPEDPEKSEEAGKQ